MPFLAIQDFSYTDLRARAGASVPQGLKPLKLALLTDGAPQFFEAILSALAAKRGYELRLYAPPPDQFEPEIMNVASGLYAFAPDAVFLMLSTQALLARLLTQTDPAPIVPQTLARLKDLWEALRAHSLATLIQANWAPPVETLYGDFERKMPTSPGSLFAALNDALVKEIAGRPDVLLCDVEQLSGVVGRQHWFDDRLWQTARGVCHADCLPLLANRLLDSALAAQGESVKAIVVDLDHVLWGGVVGDDGLSGIHLGAFGVGAAYVAFQRYLLALKRRGIVLAVVSRNDPETARLPFREHPEMVLKEEDFSVFIANWQNKADNLQLIQETLQIGFDEMVFIDDSAFERHWVRAALPQIIVPEMPEDPAFFCQTLSQLNLFTLAAAPMVGDSGARYYAQEAHRVAAKASFSEAGSYLSSLEMLAHIAPFQEADLTRLAELSSRSHQINLAARHDDASDLAQALADPNLLPLAVSLKDKYGDYGLVALCLLRQTDQNMRIESFLMSCRALGRGLEDLIMNTLVALAAARGMAHIEGVYKADDKNKRVKDFYARYGFSLKSEDHDTTIWQGDVASYENRPHHIALDVEGAG